jgi:general secretion pathway protein A
MAASLVDESDDERSDSVDMYQEFYGLRELPFELTANPKYLYLPPGHREALSTLEYGLSAAKAVTALIGEAGTGKTTLLKAALASERCRHVRAVYLNNPAMTRGEFLEVLARSLRLSSRAARSKAVFLEELERVVHEGRAGGQITALVVDEAQSLTTDLLEEIRLLGNMETAAEKLLPLVLVGQPALAMRLEEHELRQLKQRVALRCAIVPFSLPETAAYIAMRIKTVGGAASRLFTRDAVMLIHAYSAGIPRTISVICDNALVHGLALGRQPVGQEIIKDVCRDFCLQDRETDPSDGLPAPADANAQSERQDDSPSVKESGDEIEQHEQPAVQRRFNLFGARRP